MRDARILPFSRLGVAIAGALVTVAIASVAGAQVQTAHGARPGGAAAAAPANANALPPGHPPMGAAMGADPGEGPDGDAEMPPHNPHGAAGGAHARQDPRIFEPTPDSQDEDPTLPPGTIVVAVLDAQNRPIPKEPVTLGILESSVAKGDSRQHKMDFTDASGTLRFDNLSTATAIAYRLSVTSDGGLFAAMPFRLTPSKGMRVGLHVYPVVHDIERAVVVLESISVFEVRDDRIRVVQAFGIMNFSPTAWVPKDLVLPLPKGFLALNAGESMSDQGVDAVKDVGARIHGTFAPGRSDVQFSWQLPYDETPSVELDVGLPPNVAVAEVRAAAAQSMRLHVDGFPEAQPKVDRDGDHLLVAHTERTRDASRTLHVVLSSIPTPGPARYVASAIAALGVLCGLGFAVSLRRGHARGGGAGDANDDRARLLADLEELERAHRAGDVGPKTYERARREIIDALAATLPATTPSVPPSASAR